MKALVTGGAGFVGRHLTHRLLARGDEVTVVDNLLSGQHPTLWLKDPDDKVEWVFADARAFFKTRSASKFDVIFHLAAVVGGRLTIEGDPLAVATDLAIDSDLFNWVVGVSNPPKVVYFSSSAVYPIAMQVEKVRCQLAETMVFSNRFSVGMPDETYGWAKLTGELLAQYAAQKYGLNVVIYRPFSGYGEDQSFDYPFPSVIGRVARGNNPVTVWGSGEQCRDFIYIEDAIDCVFASMDALKSGEPLNIGSGVATSFNTLVKTAGEVLGKKGIWTEPDLTKPEGVSYRVASVGKMEEYYKPVTSLQEGIEKVARALTKETQLA